MRSIIKEKGETKKGGNNMVKGMMNRMHRGQKGITGLETAIILIAFVVVASVFAYTVLSAGLFSTQKSKEAVYSGLEKSRSTLELKGGVIATGNTTSNHTSQLTFTLANAAKGEPINFGGSDSAGDGTMSTNATNVVVMSYVDKDQRVEDLYWTKKAIGSDDGDDLLESNEKFQITIGDPTSGDDLEAALDPDLGPDKEFTIEIKPPAGAVLAIERTTPPVIDAVMNLH